MYKPVGPSSVPRSIPADHIDRGVPDARPCTLASQNFATTIRSLRYASPHGVVENVFESKSLQSGLGQKFHLAVNPEDMGLDFADGLLCLERHRRRFRSNTLWLVGAWMWARACASRCRRKSNPKSCFDKVQRLFRSHFSRFSLGARSTTFDDGPRSTRSRAANVSMASIPPATRSRCT